ncbi:hypothetical protein QQF64_035741 [Cirrhinus molitorella]|uniref:Uncharacterized protein n=1 Tax=Cirrhinus molitorella TaxID=172907 RepID=A0ABR3NGL9_9TELE
MFQEAERALGLFQQCKRREEDVRQEMEAIKIKYESDIQEMKEKLEKEKSKGNVREIMLKMKYGTRKHKAKTTDSGAIADTEPTKYKVCLQIKKKEDERQTNTLSGKTDVDTETETTHGAAGGEFEQDSKKILKWKSNKIGNITWRKEETQQRQRVEKCFEENEAKETASGEEKGDACIDQTISKDTDTHSKDKTLMKSEDNIEQANMDFPKLSENLRETVKDKYLLHKINEMEEHMQKMADDVKMYRNITGILAAEVKRIQERNSENIVSFQKKNHGKCVLQ